MAAKKTKKAVDYRRATDVRNCDNCASMNRDGTCQKVQGIVKPTDVCDLWTRSHG